MHINKGSYVMIPISWAVRKKGNVEAVRAPQPLNLPPASPQPTPMEIDKNYAGNILNKLALWQHISSSSYLRFLS